MANIENIFRFISLRPSKLEKDTGRLNLTVYEKNSVTPFFKEITKAIEQNVTKEAISRIALKYKETPKYLDKFDGVELPVKEIFSFLYANGSLTFKESKFLESIEGITGKTLNDLIKDNSFKADFDNLRDSILADILSDSDIKEKEEKITAIKILFILKSFSTKALKLVDHEIINDLLAKSTVVFPILTVPEKTEVLDEQKDDKEVDKKDNEKEKLETLEIAHRELSNMAYDEKFRYIPEENEAGTEHVRELEVRIKNLTDQCKDENKKKTKYASFSKLTSHPAKREFILSNKSYDLLNNKTKEVLSGFYFEKNNLNPVKAVNRIEEEISYIHSNAESVFSHNKMIAFGGTYIDKRKLTEAVGGKFKSAGGAVISFIKKCAIKAGIGDLLIVRQKLKAYELAEFAHVENALAGEFKERVHRRLDLTEVISQTITEDETEKTRDLQSTERSEMQSEAEKIVQQDANVDAGLQVSGSYGPSVSFTASLNAGFSSSVQETQKKSTSYSREVTEKATENVRKNITELQRRKVLAEVEETNTHRIDNTPAGSKHMRGIYRWLNKIYDAQIFNYGQRMMYEFIIPEPASFFLYATVENPPIDSELIKPEAPLYFTNPLKPSNLTRTNYHDYISHYNVTNAPEPPSQFTVKSYFEKQDGRTRVTLGRSTALAIPNGYEAYASMVSSDYVWEEGEAHGFRVMVGGEFYDRTSTVGSDFKNFSMTFRGEIAVVAEFMDVWSFSLGVDVFCSLTGEGFTKWQLDMYDAIMQAYLDQKMEYDSKLEQKDIQKGIEILGRNPIVNRRIEKEELKKLIIMILTNSPYMNINSYTPFTEPIMDLSKVCQNGKYIRFFENAFEWQNILYVFYPYFWGRHVKWINAIQLTDPDLDFAAFLKAGAARVQIPVRPGFEKAVAFYNQTGIIWEGNDVPLIDDDLYVPIVKEISENLGKLDDGVPYPEDSEPWEVTIPTSLVLLQDMEEIPGIRDIMTDEEIDILNVTP